MVGVYNPSMEFPACYMKLSPESVTFSLPSVTTAGLCYCNMRGIMNMQLTLFCFIVPNPCVRAEDLGQFYFNKSTNVTLIMGGWRGRVVRK